MDVDAGRVSPAWMSTSGTPGQYLYLDFMRARELWLKTPDRTPWMLATRFMDAVNHRGMHFEYQSLYQSPCVCMMCARPAWIAIYPYTYGANSTNSTNRFNAHGANSRLSIGCRNRRYVVITDNYAMYCCQFCRIQLSAADKCDDPVTLAASLQNPCAVSNC